MAIKNSSAIDTSVTRRTFLGATAAGIGGTHFASLCRADEESLVVPVGQPPSRVVQVQSDKVVQGETVHPAVFLEMLHAALTKLSGKSSVRRAWESILEPNDIVALKFNRSAQATIGTSARFGEGVVGSLIESGWDAKRIVLIEAPKGLERKSGTIPAWRGFDSQVTEFSSGADQLARVLGQVTAIINIPYLKTHNIASVTGALKNLSHAMVKHPARYHSNGCSPFVADIVANTPIRDKLRLCLVDALRVMFEGGPAASSTQLSDEGILLASRDPVATDSVGTVVLNSVRGHRKLPAIVETPEEIDYLAAAHRRGLGIAVRHGIEYMRITL